MPLAKCVRRCFDGNLTRLYYEGDVVEDMSLDHPLAKCFHFEKVKKEVVLEEEKKEEIEEEEPKKNPVGRPRKE